MPVVVRVTVAIEGRGQGGSGDVVKGTRVIMTPLPKSDPFDGNVLVLVSVATDLCLSVTLGQ